jgi:hypothetical protein
MRIGKYRKQPADRLRYRVDYSDWLDPGETITGVTHAVTPAGLVVDGLVVDPGDTTVSFFASAGVDGEEYKVSITVTTSQGQIKEDEILYSVKDL